MTKITMPEPVAWRSKYKSEPGMIGQYPWSYVEHSLHQTALNNYDIESLVTTAQAEAYADARVREVQQWQPIETAPKDGTEILAWREDCGTFIASYTSASAFPLTQAEIDEMDEETLFAEDWFTQWPQAIRLDGSEAPTAWMPLPPPPRHPT